MNIRTEDWLGHKIRFVELNPGDWWAVAADIIGALGLKQVTRAIHSLKDGVTTNKAIDRLGREQEVNVLSEKAIYRLVFKSKRPEAEAFQDWIFDIIKTLRQSTGLEGFQVFRMLDKEHQRSAMANLCKTIKNPVQVDFIKANTIANKAVSTRHGHEKMVKKNQMTPEMLIDRQPILDDTVELMGLVSKFDLPIKVSETIYDRYAQ